MFPPDFDDEFKGQNSCDGGYTTRIRDGKTDVCLWQDEQYRCVVRVKRCREARDGRNVIRQLRWTPTASSAPRPSPALYRSLQARVMVGALTPLRSSQCQRRCVPKKHVYLEVKCPASSRRSPFFQADAFNNHNGLRILDAGETYAGVFKIFLQ